MKTGGLSLEQAPPIHVPFRFFLTAPWFLLAAALILGWQGEALLASRWSPAALAVTHLITVGFLGQVMCGALLQMLPVIAGAPVPSVNLVGSTVHLLLSAGAGLLPWGFLGGGEPALMGGAICAALGFLVFLVAAALALGRAKGSAHTRWAMRLALLALLVTLGLGSALTAALAGWIGIPDFAAWVDLHLAWGWLGWIGLLIVGVAFQVVPMFWVTPPYPDWLKAWLAPLVAASLAAGTLLELAGAHAAVAALLGIPAAAFAFFSLITLWIQSGRERRRMDPSLLHWWAAMASVLLAAVAWAFGRPVLTGTLLLIGVGAGLPSGMLFKIAPFLAWFHLQHRQLVGGSFHLRVPHMLTFLPERPARVQLVCHVLALIALVAALAAPEILTLAAALAALSAALLAGLLITSVLRFRKTASALAAPQSDRP